MLKFLIPKISATDLPPMIYTAALGGVIAGIYGMLHDQVTFSISSEYFTQWKFQQFHYADFGFSDRIFVSIIGFLATWWVGLIAGWFLARRHIPHQVRHQAYRKIRQSIYCMLACGMAAGSVGYVYGIWLGPTADYSDWDWVFRLLKISDPFSFIRVAYIHNASYLGGVAGLIVALIFIKPDKPKSNEE